MPAIRIDTVFNIGLEFETASLTQRIFAYLLDFVILACYLAGMKYLLYDVIDLRRDENMGLDMLIVSLPMFLYSFLFELRMNGQTIGKKLMHIRVVSLEGGEPTLGQYLLRWITKFFEWPFLFGYVVLSPVSIFVYLIMTAFFGIAVLICITVTRNNQRLGDLAAGTAVVQARTTMNVHDTVFMEVAPADYVVQFPQVMRLTDSDINTIKSVLNTARKHSRYDTALRVEYKVKDVLGIQSKLSSVDFLEKLLEDYNYLATKES